ncbi:MAG: hypothetical protein IJ131_10575 [Eggerthellaceae bacterium]|nr:hypothetical protein [Eggerthellaceae bacterium]
MSATLKEARIRTRSKRAGSGSAVEYVWRLLLSAVLGASFLLVVYRGLALGQIGVEFGVMCASCVLASAVALLPVWLGDKIARRFGSPHAALIGLTIFALVTVAAAWGPFAIGLNSYLNCASDSLTGSTGFMQPRFAVGDSTAVGVFFFTVLLSALFGAVCAFLTRAGSQWMGFVLPALAAIGVFAGLLPLRWETGLLCTVSVLAMIDKGVRGSDTSLGPRAALPLGVLSVLGCALVVALVAGTGIYRLFDAGGVPGAFADWRHGVAYESAPNVLPEGDLRDIEPFVPTGRTELSVETDAAETIYLRGFVGEHYSDGVWEGLSAEENRTYRDLFHTLHQQGFYGQSQLASAYAVQGQSEATTLVVDNIGACRRYLYAPYGFAQSDYLRTNERLIGDETIWSSGGTVRWGLAYVPQAVRGSYALQESLQGAVATSADAQAHLSAESAYRDMVYDTCLGLSKEHVALLEEHLGARERLSTTEARSRIASYLARNQYYNTTASGNAGQDALEWFLTGDRVGHSVHYAMAATCMLRYFGVPARYVEGFVVTEDVLGKAAGSAVDVTDRSAHAWAEFYLDGVGWLPFETTPGFRNDNMYTYPGMGEDEPGRERIDADAPEEEEWPEEDQDDDAEEDASLFERIVEFFAVWGTTILLALAALLVLAAAVSVAVRRYQLRRVRALFTGDDRRQAVLAAFSHAVSVISRRLPSLNHTLLDQAGSQVADAFACGRGFEACVAINDRARFSSHDITEDERDEVVRFANEIVREYREERSVFGRIFDRVVLCLY